MLSIVGPGGVGGTIAAVAHKSGIDVEVVATPSTASVITARGLSLRSAQFGNLRVPMSARLAPTPGSSVILATKAYTLPSIADSVRASAPREIISLFNGLSHVDTVHALPAERVTCGSIRIVAERISPGEIVHHSPFAAIDVEERAAGWDAVSMLRAAGIALTAAGSETDVLWRKLRFLAPMALLTAAAGKPLGEALAGSEQLVAEVAAIATASGQRTEPEEIMSSLRRAGEDSLSSLARDVEAGRPTELDALGYDLLRRADELGIAVPAIAEAIAAIEKRIRP